MHHIEQRINVRNQLEAFIQDKFHKLLNAELSKYKHNIEFIISKKWSVTTLVNIKYSSTGWYQHDDKEIIIRIDVTGKLFINNQLCGDFTINYEPKVGFINLNEVIQKAIDSVDLLKIQEGISNDSEFLISNIMDEVYDNQKGNVEKDPRVLDVMTNLQGMNYPKKRAMKLAKEITRKYPNIHDIDALVEEALNLIETPIDDSVDNSCS